MPRVRTFVALEIDSAVRRHTRHHIQQLAALGADIRWVDPDQIHLTLKFLGDVDDTELADVCQLVSGVAETAGPIQAECRGLGAFPNIDRPRTIWMGLRDASQQLELLQTRLEERFEQLGFPAEDRKFVPHLTLGRVRRASRELASVTAYLHQHAASEMGALPIEQLVVVSSQLSPRGPSYTVLSRSELEGG